MSIKDIYSSLDKSLDRIISNSKHKAIFESANKSTMDLNADRGVQHTPYGFVKSSVGQESIRINADNNSYGVKEVVRQNFGKHGPLSPTFGCHPDFEKIDEGVLKNGYSVTMFMDIIGSTKLGVVFSPENVFRIKNDIIRCAIETVISFDGHVHRIMGDAVMAFFRSNKYQAENRIADSAIDALNCATFLIEMFKGVVIPKLGELGVDENIGIRIGIDYGPNEQVVWGKYGYMNSQEVTATSFFVDVAAKLQQKAPKNSIMIGASLAELLGLDESYLDIKSVVKNGETVPIKYVTPNYKDATGSPINYKQYVLKNEKYYGLLPVNSNNKKLIVKATLKNNKEHPSEDHYFQCSRVIKKGMGISFKGFFYTTETFANPKFKFRVVNTGEEAAKATANGNHEEYENATYSEGRYFSRHWEDTSYKGLHHMYVSFWDGDRLIVNEECFSVFIND
ncbi:nucleotide-binding domain-containing protein [Atlantibacter hermannii]|uniref:nucleotide-binding domain-containing protein n=1 Tax=Atlantibacter hermannii TaxID=565 RepID=UPI0028B18BBD|nr:adenylate/guanylate cyclase domain-containing protein [Atlantibacter hermannii]